MSNEIVTQTCPAPECNLTDQDVHNFVVEMTEYIEMFTPAFRRPEQLEWSQRYLQGLLGNATRKNVERMALELGENVRSMEHFVGQSPWEEAPVVATHQRLVAESLGEADGVALIDESSVVKQGDNSVGVGGQYCGSVGKTANGQVGVHLGYASRKGYTMIEGPLFVLEEWFSEAYAEKRRRCGLPEDLIYQTKPEIALKLLQKAIKRDSLPFSWVAADELYGDSPTFRDGVAALDKWYFTEIKCNTPVWSVRPAVHVPEWKGHGRHPIRLRLRHPSDRPTQVNELAAGIPKAGWTRATIKEGSKGPILCDFAFLRLTESRGNLPGPEVWLIIRRNVENPAVIKYYFSNAPATTPVLEFIRISGMRWPIETTFKESKGEIGFDHYEMRSWLGWHHHMLLVSMAHYFLVRLRIRFQEQAPALTIYQVRILLACVLPKPTFDVPAAIHRVQYCQKRNYVAYVSHRKSKLAHLANLTANIAQ